MQDKTIPKTIPIFIAVFSFLSLHRPAFVATTMSIIDAYRYKSQHLLMQRCYLIILLFPSIRFYLN